MGKKGIRYYSETSDLMQITIEWQKERFRFNLFEELRIDSDQLEYEITQQPSSYAFINMLWKKLVLAAEEAKVNWEKAESKEFVRYKKLINDDTGRPYSDDQAKAYAKASRITASAFDIYRDFKNQANVLETCVKGFEMRSGLLQTLSANQRKENR